MLSLSCAHGRSCATRECTHGLDAQQLVLARLILVVLDAGGSAERDVVLGKPQLLLLEELLFWQWRRRWCRWWWCGRRRQPRGEELIHGAHLGLEVAELLVHLGIQVAELLGRVGTHLAELLERVGEEILAFTVASCSARAVAWVHTARLCWTRSARRRWARSGRRRRRAGHPRTCYQLVGEVLGRSARCTALQQQEQATRYHVVGRAVGQAPGRQRTVNTQT